MSVDICFCTLSKVRFQALTSLPYRRQRCLFSPYLLHIFFFPLEVFWDNGACYSII